MEGLLRFNQEKDNWFIEHEEHFRTVKDENGNYTHSETITKSIQVEPHSCPGNYPTDILAYDGMKVDFEIATLDDPDGLIKKDFAKIFWDTPKNNLSTEEEEDDDSYSPYCPVCSGCGESGCCSPLNCEPDNPECHYPKTYTADLKLGYSTWSRFWDLLEENQWFGKKKEFMKIYDEELDIRFKKNEE